MKDKDLVEKWLRNTPSDEAVEVVKSVLIRHFGKDAIRRKTGHSHELRLKHHALAGMLGFTQYGDLRIPVKSGQRIKGYYLKRIAQGIKRLEEAAHEREG